MAIVRKTQTARPYVDVREVQKIVEEQNRLLGLTRDPNATAAQARAMILADGVMPEENLFSKGILSGREE